MPHSSVLMLRKSLSLRRTKPHQDAVNTACVTNRKQWECYLFENNYYFFKYCFVSLVALKLYTSPLRTEQRCETGNMCIELGL